MVAGRAGVETWRDGNPSMRHTTLKQLRFLSAVIKTGTVTAASSAMNVTPPAITAQVKALEDLVGLPLLFGGELEVGHFFFGPFSHRSTLFDQAQNRFE